MFSVNEDLIVTLIWGGILGFCGILMLKIVADSLVPAKHWFARLMAHIKIGPASYQHSSSDNCGDGGGGGGGGD